MNRGPFAKIYRCLWDGTLGQEGDAWPMLVFLCTHANHRGIVEMAPRAIAARCGWTEERVRAGLAKLEEPDPQSRTPDEDGRRIVRLDPRREWGWRIVNYHPWREMTPAERQASKRFRDRAEAEKRSCPPGGVTESHGASRDVTQSHAESRRVTKKREKEEAEEKQRPEEDGAERSAAPPSLGLDVPRVVVLTLPTNRKGVEFEVRDDRVAAWQEAYPAVRVVEELRQMREWLIANVPRRKTLGGMEAFITRWLAKEQDSSGRRPAGRGGHRSAADQEYAKMNAATLGGNET